MKTPKIKVIIADDERIVRKGLCATVGWDAYNMEVVNDVPDGKKAWLAFIEHQPEVVITDIVMPEMDGLELCAKVKKHAPNTKVLLLSCHRDFTYAQQGIRLGAEGYVLKTEFDDDELESYLEKFAREIAGNARSHAKEKLRSSFYAWLGGFSNDFTVELKHLLQTEWSWMQQPVFIYLLRSEGDKQIDWQSIHNQIGTECDIIPCDKDRCFIFISDFLHDKLETMLVKLKSKAVCLNWRRTGPIRQIDDWMSAVKTLYKQMEVEKMYAVRTEWPEPITKAVQLVVDNVQVALSATEVAHEVGLSRSHFSTLFKQIVGESFQSFLNKRRLECASELLLQTNMSIQEIAERVGMVDAKYFSKWFKRCKLITPSAYRTGQKDDNEETKGHRVFFNSNNIADYPEHFDV